MYGGEYCGDMINGKANGEGTLVRNDMDVYRGEFRNGVFGGFGLVDGSIRSMHGLFLQGEFRGDFLDGVGCVIRKHDGCRTMDEFDRQKAYENTSHFFNGNFKGVNAKGPSLLITQNRNDYSFSAPEGLFTRPVTFRRKVSEKIFEISSARNKVDKVIVLKECKPEESSISN